MRGGWGLVGLVVTLAIVALLVKKQLGNTSKGLALPATATQEEAVPRDSVKIQSEQIQQQVRQAMEAAMTSRRDTSELEPSPEK